MRVWPPFATSGPPSSLGTSPAPRSDGRLVPPGRGSCNHPRARSRNCLRAMYEPLNTQVDATSPPQRRRLRAPARRASLPRGSGDPFARHVGSGTPRPAVPPLEPRAPRQRGRSALRRESPTVGTRPVDDPFSRFVSDGVSAERTVTSAETPAVDGAPFPIATPPTIQPPASADQPSDDLLSPAGVADLFAGRIDANAPSLAVTPTAPELPVPSSVPVDDHGVPASPLPPEAARVVNPAASAPRPDPFGRFIDDGAPRGRTPLGPLREATSGPLIDPFASRIAGDARPSPPEQPVFKDPLAARIDPQAATVPPPADLRGTDDHPAAPPPRFSRRVEAVAVSLRTGPGENGAQVSERVRRDRRERRSGVPGYRLGGAVRPMPRREDAPRARAHPAHRNLLASLLD